FYIVGTQQLGDALALGFIVFHQQQPLSARLGVAFDARKGILQAFGGGRLLHERKGAARQTMMAILVQGDDLHRNVPGAGILFELAQYRPAKHVGQENIERYGGRMVRARQRQRVRTAMREQYLESFVLRQIDHDARIVRIVLDDQNHAVARREVVPVIDDLLDRPLDQTCLRQRAGSGRLHALRGHGSPQRGAAKIGERQIQRKGAARARRAAQLNFPAEQVREFAADRQPEAGAAVLAAGGRVGLLKSLEYDALLFRRNADAGIRDLEGHHRGRMLQDRMIRIPTAGDRRDAELHAAFGGELERVGQEILEYLLQALRVRDDAALQIGRNGDLALQL